LRRNIWHRQGRTQQESDRAERLIVDKKWDAITALL
jgi:hypothetical protein